MSSKCRAEFDRSGERGMGEGVEGRVGGAFTGRTREATAGRGHWCGATGPGGAVVRGGWAGRGQWQGATGPGGRKATGGCRLDRDPRRLDRGVAGLDLEGAASGRGVGRGYGAVPGVMPCPTRVWTGVRPGPSPCLACRASCGFDRDFAASVWRAPPRRPHRPSKTLTAVARTAYRSSDGPPTEGGGPSSGRRDGGAGPTGESLVRRAPAAPTESEYCRRSADASCSGPSRSPPARRKRPGRDTCRRR